MKFLVLALCVAAASALDMPALYSKFSTTGTPGVDSFFTIPRTSQEAEEMGWTIPEETKSNALFSTYCEDQKPNICILTDKKGSIAGYQISFTRDVDSLNIPGFDYEKKGFKSLTLFGKDLYSNQIFFVSQETILNGGRTFNNQTGEGLWLQVGHELLSIPVHESEMNGTLFRKQNCFIRMGQHYFWDARPDMTQEEFAPWFLLFDKEGNLSGFGFIAFGAKAADEADLSKYMEKVPALAIKMIAPSSPQWVFDYIDKYIIFSNHVYFKETPWKITC